MFISSHRSHTSESIELARLFSFSFLVFLLSSLVVSFLFSISPAINLFLSSLCLPVSFLAGSEGGLLVRYAVQQSFVSLHFLCFLHSSSSSLLDRCDLQHCFSASKEQAAREEEALSASHKDSLERRLSTETHRRVLVDCFRFFALLDSWGDYLLRLFFPVPVRKQTIHTKREEKKEK